MMRDTLPFDDAKLEVTAAYPPGFDHRVNELEHAKERRNAIVNELDELRDARRRFNEQSDFQIRSREQASEAMNIVIDQLSAALKNEQAILAGPASAKAPF